MEDIQEADAGSRTGIATNVVEAVVAFMIFVIGAVVVYGSRKLGSGWTSDGPGAGYFPFYIGLILCISSAAIIYQALLGKDKNTRVFVDSEQLKRVMSVLIPAGIYILAIQLLGIYVASALYIALFMVILGKYSWFKSVIVALAVNTLFFFMFEVWFKVPLFKGKFEPLSFLGY
ncbi:tripartite tricarboxylate transporter TctB family protein [Noviherbaspirillum cavernae]|uniref:Tripartite tricarboxylate transporter TctB family protein n=1 Tax=Noviherbaspirillum cavernae TaxID=2320862 RepID=A0A418WVC1_9BURK|nr:tripartite tricarboxylate transporter TctB family protein [Noviherbaspirillum cavernae]RJF96662.1 tripartite tricarboxylate transporter TctB family protein [Noviherbaspirillum cavernae]